MAISYDDAVALIAYVYGVPASNIDRVLSGYNVYNGEQALAFFNETEHMAGAGIKTVKAANGATIGRYAEVAGETATNVVNSNAGTKVATKIPLNYKLETVADTTKLAAKTGVKQAGKFVWREVLPAIAATGWGITLGKAIDSRLYNANPDFWDTHGMYALNPDTWNSITSDSDGLAGTLFNFIFGLDGDSTQAYMDEDAAAYLAMWMAQQGMFASGEFEPKSLSVGTTVSKADLIIGSPLELINKLGWGYLYANTTYQPTKDEIAKYPVGVLIGTYLPGGSITPLYTGILLCRSINDFSGEITDSLGSGNFGGPTVYYQLIAGQTRREKVIYPTGSASSPYLDIAEPSGASNYLTSFRNSYGSYCNRDSLVVGKILEPPDGVGDQDGAILPDTTGWNDLDSTKQSLQNQYPDLWNNAIDYEYVDDDGTNKSKKYIPINLPNANDKNDNQPTSGDEKQSKPQTDDTSPDTLKDLVTTLLTLLPNINPDPTGSGDTPPTIIPVGSASSLWKIYNPTQAQVDSFGAWLWDSSFVEQIKKLFNDPMQAIIGIHKVFATPSIGGTATIKVGYLDSQVSSAWVDNQYTTVDCGSVSLREYFGNVFDYSPYTKVQLYLPFIGIVDLDVGDVMRATISVVYHVDVLTGACLADVKVNRDGSGGVLYQYAGSAIVTYPVSAGNYMGMLAGVLSVAGGVAGSILSGGALAPALIGGAVGASHLHTDVSHSGGFSGCAGAMGSKKPYLIVSRPQLAMADNYQHYTGIPANSKVTLGNCDGYAKVKSVYVNSITRATEEEKAMIEAQLKAGVLV